MEVSEEQPLKAASPIEVTLLPIVIFFKFLLFAKGLDVLVECDWKMFRPRCPVSRGLSLKTDSLQCKSCSPSSKIRECSPEQSRYLLVIDVQ